MGLLLTFQYLAGPDAKGFSVPDGQLAVDQNVVDALTLAIGMGKVGGGMEPVIVKDAHVSVPALFQKTVPLSRRCMKHGFPVTNALRS